MATIPVPDFGQAVAQPQPVANVPRLDVSSGAVTLANTALQVVGENQARQLDLDQQKVRADAALKLASATNDMHDAHDEVTRGVLDGSIPTEKAEETLQQRVQTIKQTRLADMNPLQAEHADAALTTISGTLSRSLTGTIAKRNQSETAAVIDQFGEEQQRAVPRIGPQAAADKYDTMIDFAGPGAGFTPAQIAAKKQANRENVTRQFYETAGTDALTKNDPDGLGKLISDVQGPAGEAMDPMKRNQLVHQLFGWQQMLIARGLRAQNQADAEQLRRENDAVDIYNKASDLMFGGAYLSPDFIKDITTTTQGTQMDGPARALTASQATVAGFASRTADQRLALINRMKAERATPGVGVDPMGQKLVDAMETTDSKLRRMADDNPWQAAQTAGIIQNVPTINAADPTQAQQIVQQRMQQISQVETWTGKKISPFQPIEVEQIGKIVRSLPLDQAASMLSHLGQSIGNADRIAAVSKQFGDKDNTLGEAMAYASARTTEGRYTAELVLRGDQALRDKRVQVDSTAATGWKADIANQIRGAYSDTQAEDMYIDAAFKIAAATAAGGGSADVDRAINLATGGIIEHGTGKVPLPYGMKEDAFDKAIERITPADLSGQAPSGTVYAGRTPMPLATFVSALPKATLVHAGAGLYNVRAGNQLVTNDKGQRITLSIQGPVGAP